MPVKFICDLCGKLSEDPCFDNYEGWHPGYDSMETLRWYDETETGGMRCVSNAWKINVLCYSYKSEGETCWDKFTQENNIEYDKKRQTFTKPYTKTE